MKKLCYGLVVCVLILFCICAVSSAKDDSLTVTTYYPSPVGVYKQLRLATQPAAPTPCDDAKKEGMMYYDQWHELNLCSYNGTAYGWHQFMKSAGANSGTLNVGNQPQMGAFGGMAGDIAGSRFFAGTSFILSPGYALTAHWNALGTAADGILLSGDTWVNKLIVTDLTVTHSLDKPVGTFLIDHPLDPKNKVLRHSFVESPDVKNVYDGVVVLDKNGEAVVRLPDYFEALNTEYRYQVTPIGAYAPLFIKQEITHGTFVIAGGYKGLKVSWQVTGNRHDAFVLKNPIIVEEEKGVHNDFKKGEYLHPEAFKE